MCRPDTYVLLLSSARLIKGPKKDIVEMMIKTRLMGFVKKMEASPWEIINDILRCSSNAGPKIMARSMGKTGKSYLFMK